jgi:hypothetical protein
LIVFAACNPYRIVSTVTESDTQQASRKKKLAFSVKPLPVSIGQIIWNFGSLNSEEISKYINKMLGELNSDFPH